MTNTDYGAANAVFGAADRAGDYIEDDTVHLPPLRRTTPETDPAKDSEPRIDAESDSLIPEASPASGALPSSSVLFNSPAAGLAAASRATDPARAATGIRGALAKLGLPIAPSAAETNTRRLEEVRLDNVRAVRQTTWLRAVGILVANPKGGVGKTPVAILLGGVLAAIRGGSVAILEVSDDPGALNFRAEGNPTFGLGELVRDLDHVTTAGRLAGYTAPQESFASVIGSTGRRDHLTAESVIAVSRVVDEFYGVRVMDSGNVPTSSAFKGAVSVADVIVIPIMNAGDSVLEAIQLLDELRDAGGPSADLANHAIAIRLTDGRPENAAVTAEVERLLIHSGVASIHEIPYDAHIAERGQLTLAKLHPATRAAFEAAAATIVRSLHIPEATAHPTRKA